MARNDSATGSALRSPSWRGREHSDDQNRHRWQRSAAGGNVRRGLRWRRRVMLALLVVVVPLLLGTLVYQLLYAPPRTWVAAVFVGSHAAPIDPHGWTQEETAGLKELDGETIRLVDCSAAWTTRNQALAHLRTQLKNGVDIGRRPPALVLYFSLPGAVDGEGKPCWLLPDADPYDSETWLPVEQVLQLVQEARLPDALPKLIVFDCTRRMSDWKTGLVCNTFADRAAETVRQAKIPRLVALTSSGSGEASHESPELHGSVFGVFFRLALAGAGDRKENGGNGDGQVTIRELHRYLVKSVDGWTRRYTADRQLPRLSPSDTPDWMVSWSLQDSMIEAWEKRAQRLEPAAPTVTWEDLSTLWKRRDALEERRLYRWDPWSWGRIEQGLLRLERASAGGEAQRESALQLAAELKRRFDGAEKRLATVAADGNPLAFGAVLSSTPGLGALDWRAHSVALAEVTGGIAPQLAATINASWDQCRRLPTEGAMTETLKAFDVEEISHEMVEASFLRRAKRRNVATLWDDVQPLSDALAARALAERSAVLRFGERSTNDERVLPWVCARLRSADQLRRAAEDKLFLGQNASAAKEGGLFDEALQAYLDADAIGERVTAAFELRDDAWAKLPHLAHWAARPIPPRGDDSLFNQEFRQTVLPLAEDLRDLETFLERTELPSADADDRVWERDDLVARIEMRFRRLETLFATEVDNIRTATLSEPQWVHRIDAVLATPLVRWNVREELWQKRGGIIAELAAAKASAAAKEPETSTVGESSDYLARTVTEEFGRTPAVFLGLRNRRSVSDDETPPQQEVEQLAQSLRNRLREIASLRTARAETDEAKPLTNAAITKPWRLDGACRAETNVRAASALWLPEPPDDAVRRLRMYDWQQLMIFQAERCLEDFYGGSSRREEPFFSRAASDYLKAARAMAAPGAEAARQLEAVTDLLGKRNLAAREAVQVTATDLLLVDHSPQVETQIEIRPGSAEAREGLPVGAMNIFVADNRGRIGPQAKSITASDLKTQTAPQDWQASWLSKTVLDRGPFLEATADFRGNEFVAPVVLRAAGGTPVAARTLRYDPPRVTVFGHERRKASLLIILDCSHSMAELTTVEGPDGGDVPRISRMDAARRALRSLLADLADRGDAWVGVRFFGHRAAWSTAEPNKLLRQNKYAGEIPGDLRPHSDVELVLPLGRFDGAAFGAVSDKLSTVTPWGETPLYLSLTQALQDFSAEEQEAERGIVVITDGLNYQFNAPSDRQRTRQDVLTQWKGSKIPISIIGFDLSAEEAAEARTEFVAIAKETGGRYLPVNGATQLARSLQSLLQTENYKVTVGGDTAESRLGESTTVFLPGDERGRVQLSYQNARETLTLFGGENAELTLSRDGSRFVVAPYVLGAPKFVAAGVELGERGWLAGLHRPVREEAGIVFPISVQHADRKFPPRPGDMWVEISPRTTAGPIRGLKYVFYDPTFEPDRPAPIWNCRALDWPRDAGEADVQVWFKFQETPPTTTVPLSFAADKLPPTGSGFAIDSIAGVTYQVRTVKSDGKLTIGLIERHGAASSGVHALRVQLAPPPSTMLHRFDEVNRLVVHTFEYADGLPPAIEDIELRFTPRAAVQEQAHALRDPETIRVSATGDLLPLSPPSN